MRHMKTCIAVGTLFFAAVAAQAGTVYSNDFDSTLGAEWSGITTTGSVQGFSSLGGFSGSMLLNSSTGNPATASVLTLTGLESHSTVSLSFLLAVIDSWDGTNGSPAPDSFEVAIGDGVTSTTVFSHTFLHSGSMFAPYVQSYPGAALGSGSFGFNTAWTDTGYDLGAAVAGLQGLSHTSSTLVISFRATGAGWQGGTDESWGIENLQVSTNAVPLPSAAWMGLGLLGGVGLVARLRRRGFATAV